MISAHGMSRHHCAVLIVAGFACGGATAQAATPLYWPGNDYSYDRPLYDAPEQPRRRIVQQPKMPKGEAAKAEKLAKSAGKPTGPLVMAISIERQIMKVYDANGFFAETPISSGMKGHSTPMGVFSVIQKNKWHRSNIYSGAPMPYMQRLTWSGIAMHAGALPGYPASHGCVRMPMAFAVQMWGWTRMGARVVITPGEISPVPFTHPLLASIKPQAVPVASAAPTSIVGAKTADASGSISSATTTDATPLATAAPDLRDALPATDKPATDKPSIDKPAVTEAAPAYAPKRSGPIAIFVSRKDSKLYVRQNFAPLFDVPVTIAGDQPLGTHVFTAAADKDTSKPTQWTALTLPASARMTDDPALSRRRQNAGAVVTTPPVVPSNAAEALDRLQLPDDVVARLGDALVTGSSLIVSDQSITASGETGEGTDFILRLR